MTYLHNNRQFIILGVRGRAAQGENPGYGAQLVAYALPPPPGEGRGGRGGGGRGGAGGGGRGGAGGGRGAPPAQGLK
jgi:hypothetical protein